MKTIKALGIKSPNSTIMVDNILKNNSEEGLVIILSPGSEIGMAKLAKKYGLNLEIEKKDQIVVVRMTEKELAEIDITGETCPGPIIIVGDMLSKMEVGERLKVKNDNKETIEDIVIALPGMDGKAHDNGLDGDKYFTVIEKIEKQDNIHSSTSINRDKVLVVQSNGIGNAERAYATFIFSKAALSMGKKVTIFLLMDGVSIARKGNAATVKHPAFDRLDNLMKEAIEAGAEIYACELSANFRGIKQQDLVEGSKLAGAATYITLLSDPSYAVVNF